MQPYNTNNFVKLDYGNDRQDWKIAVFRILENQRQILTTVVLPHDGMYLKLLKTTTSECSNIKCKRNANIFGHKTKKKQQNISFYLAIKKSLSVYDRLTYCPLQGERKKYPSCHSINPLWTDGFLNTQQIC